MNKLLPILALLFFFSCDEEVVAPAPEHGCLDSTACNYNPNATIDNNSCFYAEDWEDECGVCDTDASNDCTQDECGVWGEDGVDADSDGVCDDVDDCVGAYDCNGLCNGSGLLDNCGICDDNTSNDCVQDECGVWGGDNATCTDECGVVNGNNQSMDECGVCDGTDNNGDGYCYIDSEFIQDLASANPNSDIYFPFLWVDSRFVFDTENGFQRLSHINFGFDGNITVIPESIGNVTSLKEVYFFGNNITSIPESIGNLSALKDLGLHYNNIESIPQSIGDLQSLEVLYLNNNQLTSLPSTICNLPDNCVIYMCCNNLCDEYDYGCFFDFDNQDQSNCQE